MYGLGLEVREGQIIRSAEWRPLPTPLNPTDRDDVNDALENWVVAGTLFVFSSLTQYPRIRFTALQGRLWLRSGDQKLSVHQRIQDPLPSALCESGVDHPVYS